MSVAPVMPVVTGTKWTRSFLWSIAEHVDALDELGLGGGACGGGCAAGGRLASVGGEDLLRRRDRAGRAPGWGW